MANLITDKQKKAIKSEYTLRLISVIFFMISILGIFLLAYVIPYYISITEKDALVAEKFTSVLNIENKENVGESVDKIMAQTNAEMKAIEVYSKNSAVASANLVRIIQAKNLDIQITRLSFGRVGAGTGQFLINGFSGSREGLVLFLDNLKSSSNFISVDSPISDLAKNTNIAFTINIKANI